MIKKFVFLCVLQVIIGGAYAMDPDYLRALVCAAFDFDENCQEPKKYKPGRSSIDPQDLGSTQLPPLQKKQLFEETVIEMKPVAEMKVLVPRKFMEVNYASLSESKIIVTEDKKQSDQGSGVSNFLPIIYNTGSGNEVRLGCKNPNLIVNKLPLKAQCFFEKVQRLYCSNNSLVTIDAAAFATPLEAVGVEEKSQVSVKGSLKVNDKFCLMVKEQSCWKCDGIESGQEAIFSIFESGSIAIDACHIRKLNLMCSGASVVTLKGEVTELHINTLENKGHLLSEVNNIVFNLQDLQVARANIFAQGSDTIHIRGSNATIAITMMEQSKVCVYGKPKKLIINGNDMNLRKTWRNKPTYKCEFKSMGNILLNSLSSC